MALRALVRCLAAVIVGACASYGGTGLVPGKSTATDVEHVMGSPADRLTLESGNQIWYYPRAPEGLDTFAARISPDGVLRSLEQTLTVQNVRKIVPKESTASDVREILGPPWRKTREGVPPNEIWQYRMYDDTKTECNFYVWFSGPGVVDKKLLIKDFSVEPGGRHR